jgi:hypothetical protein
MTRRYYVQYPDGREEHRLVLPNAVDVPGGTRAQWIEEDGTKHTYLRLKDWTSWQHLVRRPQKPKEKK